MTVDSRSQMKEWHLNRTVTKCEGDQNVITCVLPRSSPGTFSVHLYSLYMYGVDDVTIAAISLGSHRARNRLQNDAIVSITVDSRLQMKEWPLVRKVMNCEGDQHVINCIFTPLTCTFSPPDRQKGGGLLVWEKS
jgi:hypothetical protein